MIISSVKIDDNFYVLDDSGEVYEQLPEDEQFYFYRMRSKVCKGLLRKTINAVKAQTNLQKEEMRILREQLEDTKVSLRRKSREVRLLKAELCGRCMEKGIKIRATV